MTFAEQFKAARLAAGMTQKEIAEKTGIPFRTVQNWEGGVNSPPKGWSQRMILRELEQIEYKAALEQSVAVTEAYLKKAKTKEARDALADILNGMLTALEDKSE